MDRPHMIETLAFDFHFGDEALAVDHAEDFADRAATRGVALIADVLDEFAADAPVTLEQLIVDLGAIPPDWDRFEERLRAELQQALRDALRAASRGTASPAVTGETAARPFAQTRPAVADLWHLLTTGRLPWSRPDSAVAAVDALVDAVLNNEAAALVALLQNDPQRRAALARIAAQWHPEQQQRLAAVSTDLATMLARAVPAPLAMRAPVRADLQADPPGVRLLQRHGATVAAVLTEAPDLPSLLATIGQRWPAAVIAQLILAFQTPPTPAGRHRAFLAYWHDLGRAADLAAVPATLRAPPADPAARDLLDLLLPLFPARARSFAAASAGQHGQTPLDALDDARFADDGFGGAAALTEPAAPLPPPLPPPLPSAAAGVASAPAGWASAAPAMADAADTATRLALAASQFQAMNWWTTAWGNGRPDPAAAAMLASLDPAAARAYLRRLGHSRAWRRRLAAVSDRLVWENLLALWTPDGASLADLLILLKLRQGAAADADQGRRLLLEQLLASDTALAGSALATALVSAIATMQARSPAELAVELIGAAPAVSLPGLAGLLSALVPMVPAAPGTDDSQAARRQAEAQLARGRWPDLLWEDLRQHDAAWLAATLRQLGQRGGWRQIMAPQLDVGRLAALLGLWLPAPAVAPLAALAAQPSAWQPPESGAPMPAASALAQWLLAALLADPAGVIAPQTLIAVMVQARAAADDLDPSAIARAIKAVLPPAHAHLVPAVHPRWPATALDRAALSWRLAPARGGGQRLARLSVAERQRQILAAAPINGPVALELLAGQAAAWAGRRAGDAAPVDEPALLAAALFDPAKAFDPAALVAAWWAEGLAALSPTERKALAGLPPASASAAAAPMGLLRGDTGKAAAGAASSPTPDVDTAVAGRGGQPAPPTDAASIPAPAPDRGGSVAADGGREGPSGFTAAAMATGSDGLPVDASRAGSGHILPAAPGSDAPAAEPAMPSVPAPRVAVAPLPPTAPAAFGREAGRAELSAPSAAEAGAAASALGRLPGDAGAAGAAAGTGQDAQPAVADPAAGQIGQSPASAALASADPGPPRGDDPALDAAEQLFSARWRAALPNPIPASRRAALAARIANNDELRSRLAGLESQVIADLLPRLHRDGAALLLLQAALDAHWAAAGLPPRPAPRFAALAVRQLFDQPAPFQPFAFARAWLAEQRRLTNPDAADLARLAAIDRPDLAAGPPGLHSLAAAVLQAATAAAGIGDAGQARAALPGSAATTGAAIGPARPDQAGLIDEALYVGNAGLVLLGPFIPALFARLDLTVDGDFRDAAARTRAIFLLELVIRGEGPVLEPQLLLNKLICGLDLAMPLPRNFAPMATEIAVIDEMLAAIISHWSALGGTSPAGLREAFLQRDAVLTEQPDAWSLQVARRSIDVLIDMIPWGIGSLKLPWMPKLLQVNWR